MDKCRKRRGVVGRIRWAVNVDNCETTWCMVESDGSCVEGTELW